MDSKILEFIERSDAIPSTPQIVTRLMEITRAENYKQEDVISLLSTDPGVASDVLRLANSPLFGVTRQISSLAQATTLLGIKRIRTLVMGRCMVDKINQSRSKHIDVAYYWRRSLSTAVLAARFADQIAPHMREEAFMCGLLSNVGVIVLARAVPEKYAPIAESFSPHNSANLSEQELGVLGVTNKQVASLVLNRWGLPKVMVEAIEHVGCEEMPPKASKDATALIRIVSAACGLATLLCEVTNEETILPACEKAMAVVQLNLEVLSHVLGQIENDVEEFATILKLDVVPSRVYELIAKSISQKLTGETVEG